MVFPPYLRSPNSDPRELQLRVYLESSPITILWFLSTWSSLSFGVGQPHFVRVFTVLNGKDHLSSLSGLLWILPPIYYYFIWVVFRDSSEDSEDDMYLHMIT